MATQTIETLVNGGQASAAPPLGPALGPLGVNIGEVVAEINKKTAEFKGMQVPVKVEVDSDTKEFTISVGTPPASALIKKETGVEKGAGNPLADKVADLKIEQVIKIAKMKWDNLLGKNNFSKVKEIIGTCDSMGIMVEGYKLGSITKTRSKDLTYAALLTLIIAIPLTIFTIVYLPYMMDVTALPDAIKYPLFGPARDYLRFSYEDQILFGQLPTSSYYQSIIIGTIITLAIYIIRRLWPRFFLNPVGLLYGTVVWVGFGGHLMLPMIIAYVAKYVMVRFGGADFYDRKGLPLVTGILSGAGILVMVITIGVMLRAIGIIGPPFI